MKHIFQIALLVSNEDPSGIFQDDMLRLSFETDLDVIPPIGSSVVFLGEEDGNEEPFYPYTGSFSIERIAVLIQSKEILIDICNSDSSGYHDLAHAEMLAHVYESQYGFKLG